jgi:hypothetical protein
MKKLFTQLAIIATTSIFAQAPQGFNYQATVRNNAGELIVNQNVNFKFNIMLNSATSLPVFSETHMAPTDDLGQVNLVIGQGTATTGSFSTINWGTGNYYLGIELNTGSGYIAMGTTQLLSVPYALYANSSGNSQATTPNLASVLAVNNGANNLQIKNLANPSEAQDAVTKSYLETQIASLQNQINNLQNLSVTPSVNQQTICSGSSTQIQLSSNLPAVTFSWTASITTAPESGTITGFSNQTGNVISQTLLNTGNSPGIVRYTITPNYGAVIGQSSTVDITVNPIPMINGAQPITFCGNFGVVGTPVVSINDILPVGTKYTWTAMLLSGDLSGYTQIQTTQQTSINDLLSNFSDLDGHLQYTITPIYETCIGNSFLLDVFLPATPIIPNQSIQTESNVTFILNLASNPPSGVILPLNTTYSWTFTNNPNVTGATSAQPGQNVFSQTLVNTTNVVQTVIYTVTPLSSSSCLGAPFTVTVTVNPLQYSTGTVHCNPTNNPTAIVEVTNPTTGKTWMDRNLGASQVATSSTDALAYGDLYQWGRRADGHQCRNSATTSTLSSTDQPANGSFITINSGNYDWRSPQNNNLWQGFNGVNNPCPIGYRLPTDTELNSERLSWSQNNAIGAFTSPLKLTMAGYRTGNNGSLYYVNANGSYWSSTVSGLYSRRLFFLSTNAGIDGSNRTQGYSVRCVMD